MNNLHKILLASAMSFSTLATAQVEFKIERMGETNNFIVSAVPTTTYDNPNNLTSTAQVTLLAPTGDFQMDKIVNLYPDAQWRLNGRTDTPKENPKQDYIYFGLENLGTGALKFEKGKETPLFLIQAKTCNATLSLMDNEKDPFMFPNSKSVNVGNQMTILGAGGDAYKGIVKGKKEAACVEKAKASVLGSSTIRITPNITNGETVKIEFLRGTKDGEKGELVIFDASGRSVLLQDITAQKGYNNIDLDINRLPLGTYFIVLSGISSSPLAERLVILE